MTPFGVALLLALVALQFVRLHRQHEKKLRQLEERIKALEEKS